AEELALVSAQPEVPGGERGVVRSGLVHQPGKGRHVEPEHGRRLAHKLLLPSLGQREAQLVAADALRLHLKTRGAFEVAGGDPELAGVFTRDGDVDGDV